MGDTSKKIIIQFDKPLVGDLSGNEKAFIVSGKQYNYINGVLVDTQYSVISTQSSSLGTCYIELLIDPFKRFNNVIGDLTVTYNEALGTLGDSEVRVSSFIKSFTPTQLIQTPNPWQTERIKANPNISAVLTFVNRKNINIQTEIITIKPFILSISFIDIRTNPV